MQCHKCKVNSAHINKGFHDKTLVLENILSNYQIPYDICNNIVNYVFCKWYLFKYPVLKKSGNSYVEVSGYFPETCTLCPYCYKTGLFYWLKIQGHLPSGHKQGSDICKLGKRRETPHSFWKSIHNIIFPLEYSCEYHISYNFKRISHLIYIK